MNLLEVLTTEDKDIIQSYIETYGVSTEGIFCGVDKYLALWAENKKKLYKLFGSELRIKTKIELKKSFNERYELMEDLVDGHSTLVSNFVNKVVPQLDIVIDELDWDSFAEQKARLSLLLARDKFADSIKVKKNGKTLSIQKDMKPIRAIGKIINFCAFYRTTLDEKELLCSNSEFKEIESQFEKFRIAHSMVTNDDVTHGVLVLSIHPMDYLTMSDNTCGWTSCMSWIQDGCYRVGTLEMLNSNNVICCYLESQNKKLTVSADKFWNSKQWRQLVYVTKDIAVGGKAYPFQSKETTFKILEVIQELSKKNFNNEYEFGPEKYLDMIAIDGNFSFKQDVKENKLSKKILFDTKLMYNDMVNDSGTEYWCIRNKVKKLKKISYSGKATCLCCNQPNLIREDWLDGEDYNSRYETTSPNHFLCDKCFSENSCAICGRSISSSHLAAIELNGVVQSVCEDCYNKRIDQCSCGNFFRRGLFSGFFSWSRWPVWLRLDENVVSLTKEECRASLSSLRHSESTINLTEDGCVASLYEQALYQLTRPGQPPIRVIPLSQCNHCNDEIRDNEVNKELFFRHDTSSGWISKKIYSLEEALSMYCMGNKKLSFEELMAEENSL